MGMLLQETRPILPLISVHKLFFVLTLAGKRTSFFLCENSSKQSWRHQISHRLLWETHNVARVSKTTRKSTLHQTDSNFFGLSVTQKSRIQATLTRKLRPYFSLFMFCLGLLVLAKSGPSATSEISKRICLAKRFLLGSAGVISVN